MKDEIIRSLYRIVKVYFNPKIVIKMFMLCLLLIIHGYTDAIKDNRWQLFDLSHLLCVDTFVVIGCFILIMLVAIDVIKGMNNILIEDKIDSYTDDDLSFDSIIIQELIKENNTMKKQPSKVVSIEKYKEKNSHYVR